MATYKINQLTFNYKLIKIQEVLCNLQLLNRMTSAYKDTILMAKFLDNIC